MTLLPSRALWGALLAATACCAAPAVAAAAPSAATEPANDVGLASATLRATINPNGLPTTYHFEYGTTTGYGVQVPVLLDSTVVGSDATLHPVFQSVSGLLPGTEYHFRVVATDCGGCLADTSDGADRTFATVSRPLASTGSASEIKPTQAVLNGSVNPNGLPSTFHFEFGPTSAYGSSTPESLSALDGLVGLSASASVSGLTPHNGYHFRLVASDCGGCAAGTAFGGDQSFATYAGSGNSAGRTGSAGSDDSEANDISGGGHVIHGDTPGDSGRVLPPGAPLSSGTALGRREVVAAASGTVLFQLPGSSKLQLLTSASSLPMGSLIDTRGGIVTLTVALGPAGSTQSATLSHGVFRARQSLSQRGMTDLILAGGNFAACTSAAPARARLRSLATRPLTAAFTARSVVASAATARARVVRSLWASDRHGRFRTYGRNSVATVRGTRWVTQDRCDGTLTRVQQGKVSVKPSRGRRAVLVSAGHSYLARH